MFLMIKQRKKTLLYFTLSFVLPLMFILIAFSRMKIYPFGNQSLLNMDLWGQYFPMYVERYNNIRDLKPGLFSWNGVLGFNLFAQSAYYSNSLFNFILVFFSRDALVRVFNFIIAAKVCFSSLSFCFFLKSKFKEISLLTVGCSVAYSLCGYMLAFLTQPMWLDAVILFPIVLLGIERLILDRKPLMYCAALALTIFSNFYISFSVCIFSVLYFIVFMTSHSNSLKLNDVKHSVLNFASFSLLAGGLAAFVLLPVYKSINLTLASELGSPEKIEWYNSAIEYLSKLFPGTKISLEYGIPNIYSGVFILILVPLFWINKNILARKKIAYSALLIFLYASMNLNILDFLWHGLHFPNQLPGRWTFMFSFLVILMAYEVLANLKALRWYEITFSMPIALLCIALMKTLPKNMALSNKTLIIVLIGLTLYTALLLGHTLCSKISIKKAAVIAMGVLMISEAGVNAVKVMKRDVRTTDSVSYNAANTSMAEAVNGFESGKSDFYRMEKNGGGTFNPGQFYDYKGVSYYSSTMTGRAYNFFKGMGYGVYARNVSTLYNPFSPVMNSFFSIKYIIDRTNDLESAGMEQVYAAPDYKVLENCDYLPVAFMVDKALVNWEYDKEKKPLDVQNDFLNAAMGRAVNVFESLPYTAVECTNVNLSYDNDWNNQYYKRVSGDAPVQIKFSYAISEDQRLYMQHGFKKGKITVNINGDPKTSDITSYPFRLIGEAKAGDTVEITVEVSQVQRGLWGMELFALNQKVFSECCAELNRHSAQIIEASDTKIKCTVNSDGGVLYTSIPDDGGWTLKCNGKKVDTFRIGDYLIAATIPEGENTLEFSYHVPGLAVGATITLISLICIILYALVKRGKIPLALLKKSEKPEAASEDLKSKKKS